MLVQLETAVKEGLKNGKYLAAVIGVDVSVAMPEEGNSEKRHALQLHNYRGDEPVFIRYSIYEQTDEGFTFGPLFEL